MFVHAHVPVPCHDLPGNSVSGTISCEAGSAGAIKTSLEKIRKLIFGRVLCKQGPTQLLVAAPSRGQRIQGKYPNFLFAFFASGGGMHN